MSPCRRPVTKMPQRRHLVTANKLEPAAGGYRRGRDDGPDKHHHQTRRRQQRQALVALRAWECVGGGAMKGMEEADGNFTFPNGQRHHHHYYAS